MNENYVLDDCQILYYDVYMIIKDNMQSFR